MGRRGAVRHVGRLCNERRDGSVSGIQSAATGAYARRAASASFPPKELACARAPCVSTISSQWSPAFVVGINNLGKTPVDFRVAQVEAVQDVGGSDYAMQVVTYEMLVQEEKNRQVAAAIFTGLAAAGMPTVLRRPVTAATRRRAVGLEHSTALQPL